MNMTMEQDQIVDIPEYARFGKNNSVYALKKDMPYFQDEENVRGHLVIGKVTAEPGKMTPQIGYFWYCTEEAVIQKREEKLRRMQEEAAREKARLEAEEELKRNLGWQYIPLEQAWDDMTVYPINGFLTERFFDEIGLSETLDEILGPERAFWVKLHTAQMALKSTSTFEYGYLNRCPLRRHVVFTADRGFNLPFWAGIREEEAKSILNKLVEKQGNKAVYAVAASSLTTLVHTDYSDHYSDSWFVQRIRTGTRYSFDFVLYCDIDTARPVAPEGLRYEYKNSIVDRLVPEVHTIQQSVIPAFRNAPIDFYLHPYLFQLKDSVRKIPMTACIYPSQYPDQKELKKHLKDLENVCPEKGYRVLRWDGDLDGTAGHWMLLELSDRRAWQVEEASDLLKSRKKRLSAMSYYPACEDCDSVYFDIDKDDDEADFFGNAPFRIKAVKGATEMIRLDAGRFLYFTTEAPLSDKQLVRRQWLDEDLYWQLRSYVDHGETSDYTEYFDEAMSGRDLPLLLSCIFRVWLYEHLSDMMTSDWSLNDFGEEMEQWRCDVQQNGQVIPGKVSSRLRNLLKHFDITPVMLKNYVKECVANPKYFSDEYAQSW